MLTYNLSNRGNMPMYEYLYKCIRDDILIGIIKAGSKLPSKRAFAKHLNVSIVTIENAYAQLSLEGYIDSVEKSGYFVTSLENTKNLTCLIRPNIEEEFEYSFYSDLRSNRIQRNNFPFSTWAKLLRDTISSHDDALLKTVPYNGIYELRLALSEFLHEYRGMNVTPSQIIVGSGTEYLYSRLILLFGKESRWAIENIGNAKISSIYNMYNANWSYVGTDEMGPNIKELSKSGANIVHISPSNNFPLGNVMPVKRRQELLLWANSSSDNYILEDDYDSEFPNHGTIVEPLFSLDKSDKVIYMNTFSKTLIPSLRISYMVLPHTLVNKYLEKLSFYSGTVSSIEQYTLARFINDGYYERHINHMKNHFKSVKDILISAIKSSPLGKISEVIEPSAGTHFLLRISTKKSDRELITKIKSKDINIAAFSEYVLTKEYDSNTLVINYCGIHKDRIDETVRRMCTAILDE